MGYISCMGYCAACGTLISFNPFKVPSMRVNGEREPVCLACVTKLNEQLKTKGMAPINILPGAYEPAEEGEDIC